MKLYALITGASRGIGKETARIFARNGYHLYLVCKENITALDLFCKELEHTYAITCKAFCGDIADFAFISSIYKDIKQLDILVNNAAISHFGLLQDLSELQWQRIMNTNLSSCFYTSKLAIPLMLSQKQGKIINISSIWGLYGASLEVAYSTSKGAVNALTKSLAKELAPSNIQVNAIAFGMIDTQMNEQHLTKEEISDFIQDIPMGRLGTPEEAATLIYQVAHTPCYLTGQIITMDGGLY